MMKKSFSLSILMVLIICAGLFTMISFVKADNMIPVSASILKQNPAVVGEFMVTPSGEIQTHGYQRELFIVLTVGDGSTPTYDVYANYVYGYHL
jgi:hypothetical protein